MKKIYIDDLKLSDEIKNFWKEKQVYTIEELARVFLDERGRFDNDLFDEIVFKHNYSTREERTVKSAVYKSGYYCDSNHLPVDPIIFYGEVSDANPCWRFANAPARTVVEIDRFKQNLIVRFYNKDDKDNYWSVSTTKATIEPRLCERFFKQLEMSGNLGYAFDAPNKDILIRKASGRRVRDRGVFNDLEIDALRREILKRAYVIAD